MANDKLPTPATAADMYANAIVNELRALNASFKKLIGMVEAAPAPDEVELKEPVKPMHRDAKKAVVKATD